MNRAHRRRLAKAHEKYVAKRSRFAQYGSYAEQMAAREEIYRLQHLENAFQQYVDQQIEKGGQG